MEFEVRTGQRASWSVVDVAGEVDISTASDLEEALAEVLEGGSDRVMVDLRRVSFMDSSGLEVLVRISKRLAERDGRLALVCEEGGPVRRVFAITGLDRQLPIYPSVDQAL